MPSESDIAERHLKACQRFGRAVAEVGERWDRPSPCTEWNARGVLEHVIGFHDVLLLGPLGAKPQRPRDDPLKRWLVTYDALRSVLRRAGLFDGPVRVPAVGNNPPTELEAAPLVAALTQDVLVHAWDLARAVGGDDRLDADLCERYARRLPDSSQARATSGLFAPAVPVPTDADPQTRLLAGLGRDPNWQPPATP